jgi:uncharacterized protein (DUF2267 family)
MSRTEIIIQSIPLRNELNRMAMEIKSDGKGCPYKMNEVGHTDGVNYAAQLAAAKPTTDILAIPMVTSDPHFKENLALAKFRNQVAIEDAKVDARMYDILAAALGEALMRLFAKSTWAKHQGIHTFVELYAYYRLDVLKVSPRAIEEIMAAAVYDRNQSYEENMATLLAIIDAAQPYEAVTQYQQMKMMRDMIKGEPVVRKAYEHYLQQNPDFEDQSLQGAIKSITTELKNNPTLHVEQASSINSILHEEMMEMNAMLIQNQALQEARINQLQAAMNANTATSASIPRGPKPPTTKYCHLHGSNNTHDGTECKKMGSTGFTMKGKAVTQAMINNRVPGAVVDGVAGKM